MRFVFGQPGGEVVDLIQALHAHGIEFVLTGHESTAAFMAGTAGRLTGVPGACLATLGPGACNLVLGVANAFLDRDPLLAFSARTATSRIRISNKQNIPLNDVFAPICKWSVAMDGAASSQIIRDALEIACTPPRGPVYLSVPSDLAGVHDEPDRPGPSPPPQPQWNDESFDAIVTALNAARKPLGVIGIAMNASREYMTVRRFFEATAIPYVITSQAKGIGDSNGKRFLGNVLSTAGEFPITRWLQESDCILGVGFDPVESSRAWHFETPVCSIADGPTGFDQYQPQLECIGNVGVLVDRLRETYCGSIDWNDAAIADLRREVDDSIRPDVSCTEVGVSPYHLIVQLRSLLPENAIVTGDVGAHKFVLGQKWTAPRPGTFLISNGLSSMGYGPASAIAAAMICPDQPVVCITGDGAFAMMVQELETARRIDAAPLFVVLCDKSLSIIKQAQVAKRLPPRGVDFLPVDWARVAEGFGVRGESAGTLEEVQIYVESWLRQREPMVLAVALDETLYKGLRYG